MVGSEFDKDGPCALLTPLSCLLSPQRGKFRPTLPALIASNSPDSVETTTRAAFSVYLKRTSPTVDARTARECLRELCNLRGVGPATASLLMAIVNPVGEPFMSDESWECLPELSGRKIAYKESDWVVWREAFMHKLGDATDQGGGAADSWDREGARGLDKACWAYKHGQAGSGVSSAPEQILNTDKRGAQKGKPDRKSSEEQVKEARGSKRKAVASDDIQDPPKGRKAGARRKKNA